MDAEPARTPKPAAEAAPAADAPPPRAEYVFKDMRLKIGDPLQVEPPPKVHVGRADSKLIGYLEGESIVITAPRTSRGLLALRDGEEVLLRTFTGRNAFAFRCRVIKAVRLPFDHLHLAFPERIESVEVRSSPRYRLRQPATITPSNSKPEVRALIDNIGTTGALVEAAEQLGDKGDRVRLDFEVTLHGVRAVLSLKAVVRSVKQAEGGSGASAWQHGVQFEDPEDKDRLILGSLVWFQMHEHPRTLV